MNGWRPKLRRALLSGLALAAPPAALDGAEALPLYGGDVRALVFDTADPDRAFAGTAAGQLYRSDDGGASWREAGAVVPFPHWVVSSLAFDPHRDGRLWAGLRGMWGGGGVAYSDDLGASWEWRTNEALAAEAVQVLLPVRGVADRLLAGTRGGVWRSDDAGLSWRKLTAGVAGLEQVASLAVDPADAESILAGTWRRAYRSRDGGATWSGVFDGMVLDTEVFRLEAAEWAPGRVWAATCGWIYRGERFGEAWSRLVGGLTERRTRALALLAPGRLLVGTVGGAYLSEDGGERFRRSADPGLSIVALAHHPARPDRVLAATDGAGVWRSLDGGESFAPASRGLAALRVPAAIASGGRLYAAVPWAGPLSGVYRSDASGDAFERVGPPLATPLGLAIAEGRLFVSTGERLVVWEAGEWQRLAGGDGARVGVPRATARGFVVALDGRDHEWRSGRLEPLPAPAGAAAALRREPPESPELPAGSILAALHWNGRRVLATAGFGLRLAPSAAGERESVALEALENAQVGGEALGRER
jgi:photosystem II stability/assembly factor-like uncharacterized protein